MPRIDAERAIAEIDAFIHVTDQVAYENRPGGVPVVGSRMRGPGEEAAQRAYVVQRIVDAVLPNWSSSRKAYREYDHLREAAMQAKGALLRDDDLAEILGDTAPEVGAANLHPWAWESGKSLWNGGFFHQAVMEAAKRVNTETQARLGRFDASEVDLFNQAFSLDAPQPGKPRLRLAPDDGGDTYKNLHKGARSFADGLYTAIRNPGMHTPAPADGGEEQLALEQLAAFSLLARWVDQAQVEKA